MIPPDLDWAALRRRLVEYLGHRMHGATAEDVEDLAQDVLEKARADEFAGWDAAAEPDPFRYLQSRANGEVANWWRKKQRHGHELAPGGRGDVPATGGEERGARAARGGGRGDLSGAPPPAPRARAGGGVDRGRCARASRAPPRGVRLRGPRAREHGP